MFLVFLAQDCFEIGRTALSINDYHASVEFMSVAYEILQTEAIHTIPESIVLEHFAFALHRLGSAAQARHTFAKLIEICKL